MVADAIHARLLPLRYGRTETSGRRRHGSRPLRRDAASPPMMPGPRGALGRGCGHHDKELFPRVGFIVTALVTYLWCALPELRHARG